MRIITTADVEYLAFRLAKEHLSFDEPIPDFSTLKNHPFQNGNKRIAITTLLTFLLSNGKWLKADTQEFYNFTVWVAQSPAQFKEQVVAAIQKFIRDHLADAD